jgi:conserved oligomeric Golgi complex subunit 4
MEEAREETMEGSGLGRLSAKKTIRDCTSLEEIRSTIDALSEQEATATSQLDGLVESQNAFTRKIGRLDLLRNQLDSQVLATRSIAQDLLSGADGTAQRISSAVKRLDVEQQNVKATLAVVEQVAELKACVLGVHGSMGAPQDWETAALYMSRASKIPKDVLDGEFAETIVPTAEVPDPPRVTLEAAAESLCGLFVREFEAATKENDGARVTRFFKLFPLIGKADVGLDAYGSYVCRGVAARARHNFSTASKAQAQSDGYLYANALSKLFEHIAQIVDAHEPVVQRHYGPGQMTRVIERLQIEADVQGGIILDSWFEDRAVDRNLTDIKSYPFTFLVQSFLPTQRPGTTRSESPAQRGSARVSEDESVNMRDIDALLGEASLMLARWSLYTRFLAAKSTSAYAVNGTTNGITTHGLALPKYLATSNLARKVSSHLTIPFNSMTTFVLRASLERAFQLDEMPLGLTLNLSRQIQSHPPFITSAVDDVMYVVAQVLQRAMGTSQRAIIATVLPTISRVLGSDFIGMIQRKMRDEYYPKPILQGNLPPEDLVIGFLVLINNVDMAIDYIKRIVDTHFAKPESEGDTANAEHKSLNVSFPFDNDATYTMEQLKSTESTFSAKCNVLLNDSIGVVFRQVLKPRIRNMFIDAFRDVDYSHTSADGNSYPSDDDESPENSENLVPSRFSQSFNSLLRPIKRIATASAFANLLTITMPSFAEALERRLWTMQGRVSDIGAIRLERDLAGIAAAATRDGKYELRENFVRCLEIATVAGMEPEEWEELLAAEKEDADAVNGDWSLDREERRRARSLILK